MEIFSRFVQSFFDFLFPKTKKVLELESLSSGELIKLLPPPSEGTGADNIIALFDYGDNLVKDVIWEIKYRGNKKMAARMGEILYDVLCHEIAERALAGGEREKMLLIPMPVSDKRRHERGWNQAELICEAVKENDQGGLFKYISGQLVKHRHTERQTTTASRKEREENLRESMHVVYPPSVEGRTIILIDDVLTTGSTFAEARRALKEAGAKKILCFALAH